MEEYAVGKPISSDLKRIWVNGKCGLINSSGKVVLSPKYTWIDSLINKRAVLFYNFSESVFIRAFYGVVDERGKLVVKPENFNWINDFERDGTSEIRTSDVAVSGIKGSLYGIINAEGEFLIPPTLETNTGQDIIEDIKYNFKKTNDKKEFLTELKKMYPTTFDALAAWLNKS